MFGVSAPDGLSFLVAGHLSVLVHPFPLVSKEAKGVTAETEDIGDG